MSELDIIEKIIKWNDHYRDYYKTQLVVNYANDNKNEYREVVNMLDKQFCFLCDIKDELKNDKS
jgi:hypothetical protein